MTTAEKTAYDLGYFEGQEIMKLALANLQNQVRELRKDKERLDWLLSENMSGDHIMCIVDFEGQWVNTREDIDKAMEEAPQQAI